MLKSISKTTFWQLATKGLAVAAAWWFLPYWLFVFCVLGIYLLPLFNPFLMALPLVAMLYLVTFMPVGFIGLVFLFTVSFLIFGIKDLLLINRQAACAALLNILFFVAALIFFNRYTSIGIEGAMLGAVMLAAFFVALGLILLRHLEGGDGGGATAIQKMSVWVGGFMVLNFAVAFVFLPLNFMHQAALLFLSQAIYLEVVGDYFNGRLNKGAVLLYLMLIVLGFGGVFSIANWSI